MQALPIYLLLENPVPRWCWKRWEESLQWHQYLVFASGSWQLDFSPPAPASFRCFSVSVLVDHEMYWHFKAATKSSTEPQRVSWIKKIPHVHHLEGTLMKSNFGGPSPLLNYLKTYPRHVTTFLISTFHSQPRLGFYLIGQHATWEEAQHQHGTTEDWILLKKKQKHVGPSCKI